MTSETGQQIITIHKLPNISRSKGNQAIKFGKLIEYNVGNIFLQNSYEAGKLVPDLFLLFKKDIYNVYIRVLKTSVQHLSFDIFW